MLLELQDAKLTRERWLRGSAIVTGVAVLDYTRSHGVKMLRSEAQVKDPASLDTIRQIPFTDRHPPRLIDSWNARDYMIGYTGDRYFIDGRDIGVNFTLVDGDVVTRVLEMLKAGLRIQFSVGYFALPVPNVGVFDGIEHQVEQTQIVYNHVALLLDENGRYPHTNWLNDSQTEPTVQMYFMDGFWAPSHIQEERKTVKVNLGPGVEVEVDDADAPTLQAHLDAQGLKIGELTQAQKDAQKKPLNDSKEKEANKQKMRLAVQAATILDSDAVDLIDKSEREIRCDVLLDTGDYTEKELKDLTDSEIKGAYGFLLKQLADEEDEDEQLGDAEDEDELLDSASSAAVGNRQRQAQSLEMYDHLEDSQGAMFDSMAKERKGKA